MSTEKKPVVWTSPKNGKKFNGWLIEEYPNGTVFLEFPGGYGHVDHKDTIELLCV